MEVRPNKVFKFHLDGKTFDIGVVDETKVTLVSLVGLFSGNKEIFPTECKKNHQAEVVKTKFGNDKTRDLLVIHYTEILKYLEKKVLSNHTPKNKKPHYQRLLLEFVPMIEAFCAPSLKTESLVINARTPVLFTVEDTVKAIVCEDARKHGMSHLNTFHMTDHFKYLSQLQIDGCYMSMYQAIAAIEANPKIIDYIKGSKIKVSGISSQLVPKGLKNFRDQIKHKEEIIDGKLKFTPEHQQIITPDYVTNGAYKP